MGGPGTIAGAPPPDVVEGFEHVRRFWDAREESWISQVYPGEVYVSRSPELISTVLGSCVAVCARDARGAVGGMNHFMLPKGAVVDGLGASTRYGLYAMEKLINAVVTNGGRKERLELKVFGGSKIISGVSDVGEQNVAFALDYFAVEQMRILSMDVGGFCGRQVRYHPLSGRAWVKRLGTENRHAIVRRERRYQSELNSSPIDGSVELF